MAGLAFLLFFIVLGIIGIAASLFVVSRTWRTSRRFLAVAAVWLILLAIPFWDYLPATLYFNSVCKAAGVEMLPEASKGLRPYAELGTKLVKEQYEWGVTGFITTIFRKSNGLPVAVLRAYHVSDGYHGFMKPWLLDECPRPALADRGKKQAPQVVMDEFNKMLTENKK